MAHVRMAPEDRKAQILEVAYKLTRKIGFKKATRTAIAAEAGVTPGLVGVYYPGRTTLRNAILQAAIAHADKKTVRNALDHGIGEGVRIPKALRA